MQDIYIIPNWLDALLASFFTVIVLALLFGFPLKWMLNHFLQKFNLTATRFTFLDALLLILLVGFVNVLH